MRTLSDKSATKLQLILSKRLGRELSNEELELAYNRLMEFSMAVISLGSSDDSTFSIPYNRNPKTLIHHL